MTASASGRLLLLKSASASVGRGFQGEGTYRGPVGPADYRISAVGVQWTVERSMVTGDAP